MEKFAKLLAVSLVCLMLAAPGLVAFGDDVSEAEYGSQADTAGEQADELVDVILPAEIPFEIVLVTNRKEGIVASKEFKVVNKSENDVTVKLFSIDLEISDEDNFTLSETEELPEDGNNIYMELICSSGGETKTLPVTNKSGDVDFTYYLESGETGTFKLVGTVNEFGNIPWSDVSVKISVNFSMETYGAVIESFRAERLAESDESEDTGETKKASGSSAPDAPASKPSSPETSEPEASVPEESESEASDSETPDSESEPIGSGEALDTDSDDEPEPESAKEKLPETQLDSDD